MSFGDASCVLHIVDKKLHKMPATDLEVEKTEAIERDSLTARSGLESQLNLLLVECRGDAPVAAGGVGIVMQRPAARLAVGGDWDAVVSLSARVFRAGINGTEAMPEISGVVD